MKLFGALLWVCVLSAHGALFTLPKPPVLTSKVGLAWEPSTDTNVTGYNLYWGTNGSRSYTTVTNVGAMTNVTVRMLRVTNWIAATAYDGWGLESDYSEELVYKPIAPVSTKTNVVITVKSEGWLEYTTNFQVWMPDVNHSETNPPGLKVWRGPNCTIERKYF